jgi:protein-L-isoaspartate(D-aspartate) O-methyltransferase
MNSEEKRIDLIKQLILEKRIKTKEVEKAFLEIKREDFLPDNKRKYAYIDTPLEIGNGQTISAPHMVAIMVEGLDIKKGQKILEIGAGSGYHAAIVSKLVGDSGNVYSVERYRSLVKNARKSIEKSNINNVKIINGDGSAGFEKESPYDRIYVTCAAPDIPQKLIDQLKENGKLMIPVGRMLSQLILVEKIEGKIKKTDLGGCAFVPLIGKYGF